MIASRNQNQFPSSFAPLGDLLKTLMFLSNLNDFNSFSSLPVQGFTQRKGFSKVWKEKGSKWLCHFFFSLIFLFFLFALLECFALLFRVSLVLCFTWHVFCLLFPVFFYFVFHIKIKFKNLKNTKTVCVLCTLVLVYLGWPLKQSFLNFVSLVT